jgi:hypothetical protein
MPASFSGYFHRLSIRLLIASGLLKPILDDCSLSLYKVLNEHLLAAAIMGIMTENKNYFTY